MRSELLITLDTASPLSLQDQVRRGIIKAISAGELPKGRKAPSSRRLAERLGVSRNTVFLAYQQLVSDGFLISRERSGLYVTSELPAAVGQGGVAGVIAGASTSVWRPPLKAQDPGPPQRQSAPDWSRFPFPFVDGLVDPALFPTRNWREAVRKSLSAREVAHWVSGHGEADDPMLIDEIRTKILPRRGIHARADEVMITSGSQQALDIALRLFVDKRSTVAVEEPGYLDCREMAKALDAKMIHQPVDRWGMVIDERLDGADVIVVTPSHQFPTGVILTMDRREKLLRTAARNEAIILEDDIACDANYMSPSLPALRAMPGGERVVYTGNFSSLLAPALRLGYMVADARIIQSARKARQFATRPPPAATQRAAAFFLADGAYDKMIARAGREFSRRRRALEQALNHYLQRWVSIEPERGGTSCWVNGPEGLDARTLAQDAERLGVLIEPVTDHYHADAPGNVFRMGITGISAERIRTGVEQLARVLVGKMSPRLDPETLGPTLLEGEALHARMAGTTFFCTTVHGAPCTIEVLADGQLRGRAGFANEDRDEGRWWIDGRFWVRQWNSWAYGEASGYSPLIDGRSVRWMSVEGVVVDSAVFLP